MTHLRRYGSMRWRSAGYWLATAVLVTELGLGGVWDIARIPSVRTLTDHLGYPSYFLVLLGTWKVLAAVALLAPRRPLLKEWAYAGAFFTYTGALVSHLATGYDLGEVPVLGILTALTMLSWALRPPSRRTPRWTSTAPLEGLQVIQASHGSEEEDEHSRPERSRVRAAAHHGPVIGPLAQPSEEGT
jgi:hypothetical protein